jgi:hypothetical protein
MEISDDIVLDYILLKSDILYFLSSNVCFPDSYCLFKSLLFNRCIISAPNALTKIPGTTIHAPLGIIQRNINLSRLLCPTSAYLSLIPTSNSGPVPAVIFLQPVQDSFGE